MDKFFPETAVVMTHVLKHTETDLEPAMSSNIHKYRGVTGGLTPWQTTQDTWNLNNCAKMITKARENLISLDCPVTTQFHYCSVPSFIYNGVALIFHFLGHGKFLITYSSPPIITQLSATSHFPVNHLRCTAQQGTGGSSTS